MADYSDKQLKIGIWWVTHRYQLKKWWVIMLALADLVVFLYILFNVVVILFTWGRFIALPSQISQPIVNFTAYQQANAPQNIQVVGTELIPVVGQPQTYHLITELKNPNEKWMASSVNFHFKVDETDLDTETTFLLPQEQRFIFHYTVKSAEQKPKVQFVIDSIGWQRIESPAEEPKLDFEISDNKVELIPIVGDQGTYTSYSTRVTANIKNNTVYNFWKVKFLVVLYRGNTPVALNEAIINRFGALETEQLGISWGEEYRSVTNIKIVPEVNVLDPNMLYSDVEF